MKKFAFFVMVAILNGGRIDEHPRAIPDKIGLIWFSGFREEDLNAKAYEVHRPK